MRWRIAISAAALALFVVLVQSLVFISMLEKKEDEFIDREISDQINFSMSRWAISPEAAKPNAPDMWLYRIPPDGTSGDAETTVPPMFAALTEGNHEVYLGSKEYHVAVRNSASGRFILAYDVDQHETRLNSLILFAVITAVSLGVVVLLVGYYLAGRLTARLDELALKLDQDAPISFVTPGLERELLAIARALDESRYRQQAMLERERAFASNLSHELRTPLTGIRTDAEILLTVPDLPEAVGRRSQRIISGVDRINQLANSLLLLAREAKPAEPISIVLASALESVWSDLQLANPKPVSLGLNVSPGVHLQADPVLLDLVLRNVLENALRYSEAGEIVCTLDGNSLAVRDTGPGFADEDLSRVFDRNFIGQRGLHGIGLAIVQHICSVSGWSVKAANAAGGGEICIDFGAAIRHG
jgi:signal transduction histidine kinase